MPISLSTMSSPLARAARRTTVRRGLSACAATLLAAGAALGAAPAPQAAATPASAEAAAPLVLCPSGSLGVEFSPGLLLDTVQAQTFTGAGSLSGCLDSGHPLPLFGGAVSVSGQGDVSCLTSENVTGTVTIDWNGGTGAASSSISITELGPVQPGDQVAFSGTVTGGRYAGQAAVIEWIGLTLSPGQSCDTAPGVRNISGSAAGALRPV
ncbi:hypothetical protein [Streptomyces yaizuensis]|uniref:Uncharacterized protein n=1 Tax=Streptomyces yaizuensis TaxID=2989713 RepID=A0ABQ5P977_9ACTN|nr:hypothetical protein [Streptomyces sp. YSPA8]GLF99136.1 hypothetical protein SYYSPA8_32585 [Streptomyces sp. YSPA8]